jgi:hypothetical protein
MSRLLRHRAILALLALALILGVLILLSDPAVTSRFGYKLF